MVREPSRKWDPTWQTGRVTERERDGHLNPKVPARAPRDLQDEVRAILAARKLTLSGAVVALLRALRRDPDGILRMLSQDWPPEKRGRPRLSRDADSE